jgi:hypothetical protein
MRARAATAAGQCDEKDDADRRDPHGRSVPGARVRREHPQKPKPVLHDNALLLDVVDRSAEE